MLNIVTMDQNQWINKGIKYLFNDKNIKITSAKSFNQVEKLCTEKNVDIIICEIIIDNLNFEKSLNMLQWLSKVHANVTPIIFTHINESIIIETISRHYPDLIIIKKTLPLAELKHILLNCSCAKKRDEWKKKALPRRKKNYLTLNEIKLIGWFAKGKQQRAIARHFTVSHKTISSHKTKILKKLECKRHHQFHQKLLKYGFINDNYQKNELQP
ncbi:helix-turn-helix transcriptional regulator [Enterobacter mori]|uniref:helix-turn-helix transcriptional regulator n=1 Tax=Enterobacter mori TaxID=539813 RepID=UPI001B8C4984|nr:LuxR C-terminal-related transcriptional regulator [Enterobacter mori]MBS3049726.1 hypothetical protein [Enterobacter mori]